MNFAIKTAIEDESAGEFTFVGQKTMYGGKRIGEGDRVYLFASENEGGRGLMALGRVLEVSALPKIAGRVRQTPRVSVRVQVTKHARRALGRAELKPYDDWSDPRPEVELNFKLYRQATNKIVGLTPATGDYLDTYFS